MNFENYEYANHIEIGGMVCGIFECSTQIDNICTSTYTYTIYNYTYNIIYRRALINTSFI